MSCSPSTTSGGSGRKGGIGWLRVPPLGVPVLVCVWLGWEEVLMLMTHWHGPLKAWHVAGGSACSLVGLCTTGTPAPPLLLGGPGWGEPA
jgi:hypothetical protein